jgi:hypothetical protein
MSLDHWCWSGTNSKGKFGVFPQSHIASGSIREVPVATEGKKKTSSGPLRLFSRRRRLSSTPSSFSGDTGGSG